MIINKLRLQEEHPMTGSSNSWPLPLCDLNLNLTAGENGYMLKGCQGLGPPLLIPVVVGFDSSGIPIWESVPDERVIVLKIGLTPALEQSYGALRDNFYRLISRTILVKLMSDSIVIGQASGFIQRVEPVHFSNKPELEITIVCEDGEFSAPASIDIPLATLDTDEPVIDYISGTAPAGIDLQFTVTANHSAFTISNHAEFWHSGTGDVDNEFTVTYPMLIGDIVNLSTHSKSKRITLLRSAVLYDLAGFINAGAVWPKLYSGVNTFEWTILDTWMTLNNASYIPRFWGV